LLVLIWLVVVSSYPWLHSRLVDLPQQQATTEILQREANRLSDRLTSHMDALQRQLEQVAAAPDTLTTLFIPRAAPSTWAQSARVLASMDAHDAWYFEAKKVMRDADRLHLINPATRDFPLEQNFVAQLLYEAALQGESPPPRAAKTDSWAIYIARPIREGNTVQGVLLARLLPDALTPALTANTELKGRLELVQTVRNFQPATILSLGDSGHQTAATTATTGIPDWQLRFTGSPQLLAEAEPSPLPFNLALGLILVAALALSVLLIRRNLSFLVPTAQARSRLDPLDDLFTEKHLREATSLLEPLGPSRALKAKGGREARDANILATLPAHVFRDYDIRGEANSELTEEFASLLGKVLGTMILNKGQFQLALCADGRKSSPMLKAALGAGILSTGCDIVDIGEAPTPVLNFTLATQDNCHSGVMITASHNPARDNGFKIIIDNQVLESDTILALRDRMAAGDFARGDGESQSLDLNQAYVDAIVRDVMPLHGLSIAVDCGNGIAGAIAPTLFRNLGCQVNELFTDVDGDFPNHSPDPTVAANLKALISTVRTGGHDLGLAFDGDGDRVVAVTGAGHIVWPDELLMIFARDIVTRTPGADVVFDVKSTRRLAALVSSYGGRPVMWKTGHAHMRRKMKETSAPVGGEFSGHIFFNDRWHGFDDGLYAAARLLEIITLREQTLDEIVASFPPSYATSEIKIPIAEERKNDFVAKFIARSNFGDAHLVTLDGLRVEYPDGWGLIRASNTSAALTLRFEADTAQALEKIITAFKTHLHTLDARLELDF